MTHICVTKLTIIGSDNGLSPGRRQAIIWNNAWILSIERLGTNCSEILIAILIFSFKKMRLKVSSAKWRPFCLGLNVLIYIAPTSDKIVLVLYAYCNLKHVLNDRLYWHLRNSTLLTRVLTQSAPIKLSSIRRVLRMGHSVKIPSAKRWPFHWSLKMHIS